MSLPAGIMLIIPVTQLHYDKEIWGDDFAMLEAKMAISVILKHFPYIGIGEEENVQLFYYFVESERNPKDDPLLVWQAGGPGCSDFGALFTQFGPLQFNTTFVEPTLTLNPYSWTQVANILFFDNSPGAGFSYARNQNAYRNSDTLSAAQTYEFLRKWLKEHPKFVSNPLYIAGISYTGIVLPVIVQNIYNGNELGNEPIINIKGYILNNPLTDRSIDFNSRIPYAHQFALLSNELFKAAEINCHGDYINENPSTRCVDNLQEIDKCLESIFQMQILEPICLEDTTALYKDGSSSEKNRTNAIRSLKYINTACRENGYSYFALWANEKSVREALHIHKGTIGTWELCNSDHYVIGKDDTATYTYDVSSSLPYHKNLTKKSCRALVMSGDHDMVFPYIGTRKWIRSLNLTVGRPWTPWFVGKQVAGYTETYMNEDYSLTFATVKGAGHSAPEYKPEECLAMVDRWFGSYAL
ncbi:hypothetical protein AgCh_035372 [Apium graveolens]